MAAILDLCIEREKKKYHTKMLVLHAMLRVGSVHLRTAFFFLCRGHRLQSQKVVGGCVQVHLIIGNG